MPTNHRPENPDVASLPTQMQAAPEQSLTRLQPPPPSRHHMSTAVSRRCRRGAAAAPRRPPARQPGISDRDGAILDCAGGCVSEGGVAQSGLLPHVANRGMPSVGKSASLSASGGRSSERSASWPTWGWVPAAPPLCGPAACPCRAPRLGTCPGSRGHKSLLICRYIALHPTAHPSKARLPRLSRASRLLRALPPSASSPPAPNCCTSKWPPSILGLVPVSRAARSAADTSPSAYAVLRCRLARRPYFRTCAGTPLQPPGQPFLAPGKIERQSSRPSFREPLTAHHAGPCSSVPAAPEQHAAGAWPAPQPAGGRCRPLQHHWRIRRRRRRHAHHQQQRQPEPGTAGGAVARRRLLTSPSAAPHSLQPCPTALPRTSQNQNNNVQNGEVTRLRRGPPPPPPKRSRLAPPLAPTLPRPAPSLQWWSSSLPSWRPSSPTCWPSW